ncbi:sensor histidine kinase [Chitinophaga pinensis]|uniref:histidine kinase n=1 Tax=Chitinophaga pinensis (strain ATCC 43595 / DSM 2588 / LMG 13176 / NBRC 15968 / NCIMB 11800 / UQM 2034) TaxID=485918 RepID=A0A979G101_CHIPD|nr:7TM diverse intracellular signaling domain-containing protein [Chitinophaga pinensis]ACU58814.1 Diverse 7TM receptor transmembrane region [Chitinophaga pinensis DSM 2588]
MFRFIALWLLAILGYQQMQAATPIVYHNNMPLTRIGKNLEIYTDKTNALDINAVSKKTFSFPDENVPNLQITPHTHWVRFTVTNESDLREIMLEVEYPTIDDITLFELRPDGTYDSTRLGEFTSYHNRPVDHQNYIFPLYIATHTTRQYYLRVIAGEQVQLPMSIGTRDQVSEKNDYRDLIFGLYIGVMLAMSFYNLFLYLSTKDNSYLTYVSYNVFVALTQATLQGYSFRFLYPDSPWMAQHATVLVPILNGLTALVFIQQFLLTKQFYKKGHRLINILLILYMGCFIPALLNKYIIAQIWVQMVVGAAAVSVFYISLRMSMKGYSSARFFLLAWSIFLLSVLVFVLRNANVLPYNEFTYYALQIGSGMEALLLSFALAYKINLFKAEALHASQENERLVKEQNIILEEKVTQRTEELQTSNEELNVALKNLKEAQTQLVEREKMASLGQLTAGIAHEINNPINFVTSNIKPLKLDIQDIRTLLDKYDDLPNTTDIQGALKDIAAFKQQIDIDYIHEEISSLIKGIEDGASRTSEIVRGLRTFSRLDESDVKSVDLHEGIDSTLVLLKNSIPTNVKVIKDYGSLPKIECYAGKINQVFMNILTNAFNAIKTNNQDREEVVTITTREDNGLALISIKDTGPGMTEQVKEKIFDPFFTTKDVGEGTGLGLSIVFSIIEKHNGRIEVITAPDKGAEFIIYLPMSVTAQAS